MIHSTFFLTWGCLPEDQQTQFRTEDEDLLWQARNFLMMAMAEIEQHQDDYHHVTSDATTSAMSIVLDRLERRLNR